MTGILKPREDVIPLVGSSKYVPAFARSVNYFILVLPALVFGILISGAIRSSLV